MKSSLFFIIQALFIFSIRVTHGQQIQPFIGQSFSVSPVDVYLSASLDRLLAVDDRDYSFTCVMFIILSWKDTEAARAVIERSVELDKGGPPCKRLCSSEVSSFESCCDSVWLPSLSFSNTKYLSEERLVYEVIQFGGEVGSDGNSTSVQWIQRILGTFSTNMNFKRFPFDSQNLRIEVESRDERVSLHGSAVGTRTGIFDSDKVGDDVSGWRVNSMKLLVYNATERSRVNDSTSLARDDPLPFRSATDGVSAGLNPSTAAIILKVDRLSTFFIVNMVIPTAFTVGLSWSVFAMNPKQLNTRVFITVSLLFALVSLNFVISQQLPSASYLTCIHWILILSYVEIAAAEIETLYVHYYLRKDLMERTQEWRRQKSKSYSRPKFVYGTLTSSGLYLSYNPYEAVPDHPTSSIIDTSHVLEGFGNSSSLRDAGNIQDREIVPDAEASASGGREKMGTRPESPKLNSAVQRKKLTRESSSSSSSGRAQPKKVAFSEEFNEEIVEEGQDRVQQLMGELENGLPSKDVILEVAMSLDSQGKRGLSLGSASKKHLDKLKAMKRRLPKRGMLRRLSSARQKIQEQSSEEEVAEGVVVIDRACLFIFPIFYVVVVIMIIGNYLFSPN